MPPDSRYSFFKVGDKVRTAGFPLAQTVEWVGHAYLGLADGTVLAKIGARKVVEYPELWFNIYPGRASSGLTSVVTARSIDPINSRIGILHLRTDGTTEMLAP